MQRLGGGAGFGGLAGQHAGGLALELVGGLLVNGKLLGRADAFDVLLAGPQGGQQGQHGGYFGEKDHAKSSENISCITPTSATQCWLHHNVSSFEF